jgi:hypothetical protein
VLLSSYTKGWCIGIYGTTLIDVAFLKSHTLIVITNPNEWDIEVTSPPHKRAEGGSLLCSHFSDEFGRTDKNRLFFGTNDAQKKQRRIALRAVLSPSFRTSSTPLTTAFSSITISV